MLLLLHAVQEARDELRQLMAADELTLQIESVSSLNQEDGPYVSNTVFSDGSANFQRKIGSLRFVESSTEVRGGGRPDTGDVSYSFSPVLSGITKQGSTFVFYNSTIYIA